jgi:2-keto-4-pentenoate hydratase
VVDRTAARGGGVAIFGERGRPIYGATEPGVTQPTARTSDLSPEEVAEVVEIISSGRHSRESRRLPNRLQSRSWASVEAVFLSLIDEIGWEGAGWKVGAASEDVRLAEGVPSPSPGRLFKRSIFENGAQIPPELFVNYRLCESEFAFRLNRPFLPRSRAYTEGEVIGGIESFFPAIEIGDSVFSDWYSASGYFGTCLDNGGGAAFVAGAPITDWQLLDLPNRRVDLSLNGQYLKSGFGRAAMGHPVTSLAWLINWLRVRGRKVDAGEIVSTGTCTGHCFVARGDTVTADFGELGVVEAHFA